MEMAGGPFIPLGHLGVPGEGLGGRQQLPSVRVPAPRVPFHSTAHPRPCPSEWRHPLLQSVSRL